MLKEEKKLHSLYRGRVYYMNVKGEETTEHPYPLHFSPYYENKPLETSIYGHDKYYKEFQSATVGTINGYKILCVEYNGHKLARFMDKSVSISCTEQLLVCLREFCLKKINEGGLDETHEVKIPIDSVITLVKEEFGYFLPYLILKRSKKKIKRVKFERLLDENYKIQDTIVVRTSDYVK